MQSVILSGGSGTRLWPLSRELYPKQFLPLYSKQSLLQDTIIRLGELAMHSPMIICNHETRFIVAEHLRGVNAQASHIVLEPVARNTAPAIAVAAELAMQDDKDAVLLILPSDHVILDTKAFGKAVNKAEALAKKGYLVTFGIVPDGPNTEYGYIEAGEAIIEDASCIQSFKEKPTKHVAEGFIKQGNYFWNSGMFVFKASVFLDELKKHHPAMVEHSRAAVTNAEDDLDFKRLEETAFAQCESISIDYAVMEKTHNAAVVTLDANWSDVGSWSSLWDISEKDKHNNVSKGNVVLEECKDSYFYSENKLVSAIGVENIIVVDTKDALLVADKTTGNIRKIVASLKDAGRSEVKTHRVVYRPWGYYDSICTGERDKVKRITVNPGAKLSKQIHKHRAEHWVVVKGVAEVTKGEEVFTLHENESVYLPKETVHSLANLTNEPLEIIEVQTGSYLEEDDIIRLDDVYGRA